MYTLVKTHVYVIHMAVYLAFVLSSFLTKGPPGYFSIDLAIVGFSRRY